MIKRTKLHLVTWSLLIALAFLAFMGYAAPVEAKAANVTVYFGQYAVSLDYGPGDYFTDDHGTCKVHYTDTPCKDTYGGIYLGARQCYGYARYIQQKLFGVNEYTNSSKFYDVDGAVVAAGNLTASKLKSIMTSGKVQPGAHIRTQGSSPHSMVVTQITDSGFSVIQCNGRNNQEYSGYYGCRIGTSTYSWQSYVDDSYGQRGIAFIKMPYDYKINPITPVPVPQNRTENTSYSSYVPFSTYALSTGKLTVYDYNGSAYSQSIRYIDGASDLCVIQKVFTDGFCEVTYPSSSSSSGYFTALAKLSDFISSPSLSTMTSNAKYTAYRRSSGNDTIGSVFNGDNCLKVATANGRTQVIYPAGSTHKMGWIAIGSIVVPPSTAEGYRTPCKSYPRSGGHISVYAQAGGNPEANRYIDGATDLCTIEEIYSNGWCKVTYPITGGTRTAYTPTSEFIQGSTKIAWSATENMTAYRRSSGNDTVGSVDAGDRCVKVGEENGRIQLMYPVTGTNYYKMGWVNKPQLLPQGAYDTAAGGMYSVRVTGWAFDRDDLNQALRIHVYVGSKMLGECIADKSRPDVNNAYPGVGNNHGFDATFDMTNYTGSQSITVYAINIGSGNSNPSLGTKTVNVSKDTTNPTISNVSVSNLDSSGYTVSCTVTDDTGVDRVQFPTWTSLKGQDDIIQNWQQNPAASGTRNGNTYTYRVNTLAHNGEMGTYVTHIYAYDIHGNSSVNSSLSNVNVPVAVEDVSLSPTQLTLTGLNASQTLTAIVKPDNATNKTVTWKSNDTSIATVSNGKVTAVGYGTANITATSANGISGTCKVTVQRPNYVIHYDANGGTGAPADQTKVHDTPAQLSSVRPVLDGYTFLYWNTESDESGKYYYPGESYSSNQSVTLYAIWGKDGEAMTSGNGQSVPDGDYLIYATEGRSDGFALDIEGSEIPAANETNVSLHQIAGNPYDVWTVKYLDNGFYSILQRDTNMALTVENNSVKWRGNLLISPYTGSLAQQWSIEDAYIGTVKKGQKILSRLSGFAADISGANLVNGTNVNQWKSNMSAAQSWLFIPFEPEHTLPDGRYILVSVLGDEWELDVAGDSGSIPDGQNVQIWNDDSESFATASLSRYNAIDIRYSDEGYYKLIHAASGKALTVLEDSTALNKNVVVSDDTGALGQQWAIVPQGNAYALLSRCSGYALEVQNSETSNGANVDQYRFKRTMNKQWRIVPAEYTVSYNVNGGTGAFAEQIKYYKGNLTLHEGEPLRKGMLFGGWSVHSDAKHPDYQPGGIFTLNTDTTLYAVWYGPDFILPGNLKEIGEEAFMGNSFKYVVVPEGVTKIGARAFSNCPYLAYIKIPDGCYNIANDAFEGVYNLTIIGSEGSFAEFFANKHSYLFEAEE